MPNENLGGGYGLREAYGSENLMLGAFLAGFGKTNARAPTVAGLVWPRHYTEKKRQKATAAVMQAKVIACHYSHTDNSYRLTFQPHKTTID